MLSLNDGQPQRMELLAELLESNLHPRLDPDFGKTCAQAIRDEAASLRAAHEAVRPPKMRVTHLEKMTYALARCAQTELMSLKRRYLAGGFTEVEIHQVIPDHPRSTRPPIWAKWSSTKLLSSNSGVAS